jgi:hypothetical protein
MLEGLNLLLRKKKLVTEQLQRSKTGLTAQAMKELLHYKLRVVTRPTL